VVVLLLAPEDSAAASKTVSLSWECSTQCDLSAVEPRDDRRVRAAPPVDSVPTDDSSRVCSVEAVDSVQTADSSLADWAVDDSAGGGLFPNCHGSMFPKLQR